MNRPTPNRHRLRQSNCALKDGINSSAVMGNSLWRLHFGGDFMVPWWAVPLALVAGVVIGILLIALVSVNQEDE